MLPVYIRIAIYYVCHNYNSVVHSYRVAIATKVSACI